MTELSNELYDKAAELFDKLEEFWRIMWKSNKSEVEDIKNIFLETITDTEFIRKILDE